MQQETSWQFEEVKAATDVAHYHWYYPEPSPEIVAEVDLRNIVGTDHAAYNQDDWVHMRENLVKRDTEEHYIAMVRDNPDHSEGEQPIVVSQYGEEYILRQGGNHRVCYAKFAGLRTIQVRVRQYHMDPALVGRPAALEE